MDIKNEQISNTIVVADQAQQQQDKNQILLDSDNNQIDKLVNRLRDLNVDSLLWYFALPALIANAVSAITNTLQGNIQKSYLGDVGLSAQGIVQPLELILTMYISVGLSGGLVYFISPALGRRDFVTAQKYLMHYMVYYLLIIIIIPLFTLPFMNSLVISLGAEQGGDIAKYASQYGYVIFSAGTIVYSINYGFGNILRATSRSVFNSVKQICTALIELLCVYLFYKYVVGKGLTQTYTNAAAPVIANFITAIPVILLYIPFRKFNKTYKLKFSNKGWKPFDFLAMWEILYIAIPDLLTQFQIPIVVIVGNKLLARITHSYIQLNTLVTVLTVVYKTSPLIVLSNQTFSFAFGPSFGYALGMRNWTRVREIMRKTFYYQTSFNFLFWIVMNIAIEAICKAMLKGYTPMIDDCTFGFRCYNAVMPLMTCFLCVNDINQMEQKPIKAILIQVSRLVLVLVFEAVFTIGLNNSKGLYYGVLVGDLVAAIIGMINFVERYLIYGKLERGEITTKQAGIAEVTGDSKKCWRRARKTDVETRDIQVISEDNRAIAA
ncbi:DinF_protein [Hexamita inflata]|uniref:DinF protein n=1 Tax=Hexamita inflata TaxID=28002 RepID=A0AA86QAL7_9EUKA|nr:DinF protein [Hexamita inflata]